MLGIVQGTLSRADDALYKLGIFGEVRTKKRHMFTLKLLQAKEKGNRPSKKSWQKERKRCAGTCPSDTG
jgi:hypothetical protein